MEDNDKRGLESPEDEDVTVGRVPIDTTLQHRTDEEEQAEEVEQEDTTETGEEPKKDQDADTPTPSSTTSTIASTVSSSDAPSEETKEEIQQEFEEHPAPRSGQPSTELDAAVQQQKGPADTERQNRKMPPPPPPVGSAVAAGITPQSAVQTQTLPGAYSVGGLDSQVSHPSRASLAPVSSSEDRKMSEFAAHHHHNNIRTDEEATAAATMGTSSQHRSGEDEKVQAGQVDAQPHPFMRQVISSAGDDSTTSAAIHPKHRLVGTTVSPPTFVRKTPPTIVRDIPPLRTPQGQSENEPSSGHGAYRVDGMSSSASSLMNSPLGPFDEVDDTPSSSANTTNNEGHHGGQQEILVTAARVYDEIGDDTEANLDRRLSEEMPRIEEEIRARILDEAVEANVMPQGTSIISSLFFAVMAKKTMFLAALVILVGSVASIIFLYTGIQWEHQKKEEVFKQRARDFIGEIITTWRDFEMASIWIHESCQNWRQDGYSHKRFQQLYNYQVATGLDVFQIEWIPNITNSEREDIEEQTSAYFENHTVVNYTGFWGMEADPAHPEVETATYRSEQPFYFPVHFIAPIKREGGILGLDVYSKEQERDTIYRALETREPVLTEPFYLVGDRPQDGLGVVLYSAGVPTTMDGEGSESSPDVAAVVVEITHLLKRTSTVQATSLAAYLYDSGTDPDPETTHLTFMGGVKIKVHSDGSKELTFATEEFDNYANLETASLQFEQTLLVGHRQWTVVVQPSDGTFDPDIFLVILSGALILGSSLFIAAWMVHSLGRSLRAHQVDSSASS
ncbi:Histidine kinase [Seminavis robusta]|uniref:Histidine kinase n=1 Tax=Seminavis robusta TaxID=568900 RepID=A0A9N8HP92_9STRA|nr:Histidine kinase [Seminavis robusta]|eukprot:Sro1064_g237240.1 Histidine kinase (791) ;mRNA; f:14572-16944